ncbi:MAG: DUF4157 domain-containing protein [Acidimicrobiia bacterium]|nr:DUF4157 domain-containing protein [Acidimicrobiia bacterium]
MTTSADEILGDAAIPELLEAIDPIQPEDVAVVPTPAFMIRGWARDVDAMTIGSTIYLRPGLFESERRRLVDLIVHELVHVRQWGERTAGSFLSRYLGQYLLARLRGAGHHVAYRSIGAEVEAREVSATIRRLLDDQ